MPALGSTGPFRKAAGYGTIVEGMGGFGSLFGPPEAGARISQTYYPDPVSGIHATLAALAMLEQRDRTGAGGEVDLSHQETLWLQLGEALVSASRGEAVPRLGNQMPGLATSGVFPTREGRWVAVASDVSCEDLLVDSGERDIDALLSALAERGARATEVLHYAEAREQSDLAPALERLEHPATGEHAYLRVPLWLDGKATDSVRAAPTFDQHTTEVLEDWIGIAPDRLAELIESTAAGGAPDPEGLRDFYIQSTRRSRTT